MMSTRSGAASSGHPKKGDKVRTEVALLRSQKVLPDAVVAGPGFQRHQIASDVLVLLPDTTTHHLRGGRL